MRLHWHMTTSSWANRVTASSLARSTRRAPLSPTASISGARSRCPYPPNSAQFVSSPIISQGPTEQVDLCAGRPLLSGRLPPSMCVDRRSGPVVPWLEKPAVLRQVRVGACGEVETTGPSLPALHLRDADLDPSCARVWVLRGVDPAHPFPARHRGDLFPQVLDLLRGTCQSCRKIGGTLGSGQSLVTSMASAAVSPAPMPAACCSVSSTRIQWPEFPSGSSTVWNPTPLIVPRTATCPREGRRLLAVSGSCTTIDVPIADRVASKRMAASLVR